ncbi:member of asn/thr-rich large protein family [Methanosphaera stadtmanae DSM 3091]|uniref:Member of asn/thr-rich large protein family n=4 Tax=Methanosphaera TaxID=2316 RepID=Q2NI46_METST|nr:member of asn/thr-rich large protein family [Methanosphaera stadtmanae DSM 3091]
MEENLIKIKKISMILLLLVCLFMLVSTVCASETNTTDNTNIQITTEGAGTNHVLETKSLKKSSVNMNKEVSLKNNTITKPITKSIKQETSTKTNITKTTPKTTVKNNTVTKTTTKQATIKPNRTIYISNSGSDKNNGSQKAPFRTLNYACDYAMTHSDVNSIYIYNGQYRVNQTISITKNINITGQSKPNTLIKLENARLFELNKTKITFNISKLTVKNGNTTTYGAVIKINSPSTTLYVNNISCMNNKGSQGGAIGVLSSNNRVYIKDSTFKNNIATVRGGALCFSDRSNVVDIINCLFVNNTVQTEHSMSDTLGTGGAIYSGGNTSLVVSNSSFGQNTAGCAGAIYNANNGTLIINSSSFTSNRAEYESKLGYGGAIMIGNGFLTVKKSTFRYNYALNGGAISINSGTNASIFSTLFYNNHARETGGAISCFADLLIDNTTFTSNKADKYGGAFYNIGASDIISINNTIFTSNKATNNKIITYGGAICGRGFMSVYNITNSRFNNNLASYGGAISSESTYLTWTLKNTQFNNNVAKYASSRGGAFYMESIRSQAYIEACSFKNNTLAGGGKSYGGAISIFGKENIISVRSTYCNGNLAQYGGALYNHMDNYLVVANSEFIKNKAPGKWGRGGAIFANDDLRILDSVFLDNTAGFAGGAIFVNKTCQIVGSSLYNNKAGNNNGNNMYSTTQVKGEYNWWGYNNISMIKKNNYNVNDDCPIVFSGHIYNCRYNPISNVTIYTVYADTYFYNDNGTLRSTTHVIPPRNITIFNNKTPQTKTVELNYKGYYQYIIPGKVYTTINVRLDGTTLKLIYIA